MAKKTNIDKYDLEAAKADAEDIKTGRIKSKSHMQALNNLYDAMNNLESTAQCVTEASGDELYQFVNSKTVKELTAICKRIREITKELDETFGLEED